MGKPYRSSLFPFPFARKGKLLTRALLDIAISSRHVHLAPPNNNNSCIFAYKRGYEHISCAYSGWHLATEMPHFPLDSAVFPAAAKEQRADN